MAVQPKWEIREGRCIWQFIKKRHEKSQRSLSLWASGRQRLDMWLQSRGTMLGCNNWLDIICSSQCLRDASVTDSTLQSLIRSVWAGAGGEILFHSNCILSGNDSWLLCCPACKQRNLRRLMVVVVPGGGNSRLSQGLSRFYSNRSLPQASR